MAKPDAPFDAKVWKRAAGIAAGYRLIIQPEPAVGYVGRAVELLLVMADGATVAACAAETMEALTLAVAAMLERGEKPPAPSMGDRRTAQVNVRLTEVEKLQLEDAAQRQGFRGISDYVRAAAIKEAG